MLRDTGSTGDLLDALGLYGPASEAWRLNREAVLLLVAGPRALLLQIAHPLVAEGVEQHSDFRTDPWRRLEETISSYLCIVYGTRPAALAEIGRLNRLHRGVAGPVRDAEARLVTGAAAYAARDPALTLWVHATLIDSTLAGYEALVEPLDEMRRAAFYRETRPIGLAFGIPEPMLPADLAAFRAYMAAMVGPGGPIQVTPTARELSQTILHASLAPLVLPPAERERAAAWRRLVADGVAAVPATLYDWMLWPALDLLPARIQEAYEIPHGTTRRAVGRWLTWGFRLWRPRLPPRLRWMPQALAADRRAARAQRGWRDR